MGFVWGNNSVSVRPGYVDTSLHIGPFYLPRTSSTVSSWPS